MIRIGTAGWSIGGAYKTLFGEGESHLARYATRFNAAEINSSFYRPHRVSTYARWAATVPKNFRFSAKLPKTITHTKRLKAAAKDLDVFLIQVTALGDRLGPLLVQLPPSLAFDARTIDGFAKRLRKRFDGQVVWEPRHASWFTAEANALLASYEMACAAANPAIVPAAAKPGGWKGFTYRRLHGSPRLYYSNYEPTFLDKFAKQIPKRGEHWVMFDNTTLGFATPNAFALQQRLR